MCWGRNTYGEIGDGTRTDRSTPVSVVGLPSRVVALATGDVHSCVILDTGGVNCWGLNNHRQLGDGTAVFLRTSPTQVAGLTSGVTLLRTGWASNCVSVGGLKCWGLNAEGELGDGTTINRSVPVGVVGLSSGVQTLEFGYGHACAIRLDGKLVCWGQNDTGQVGDGTTVHRSEPVAVTAISRNVSALALGWYHTCVIDVAGDVACWGDNSHGQLGLGGASLGEPSPVTGFLGLMRTRAQLITRSLTSGDHVLTAVFAGDATLAGSSATLIQNVQ